METSLVTVLIVTWNRKQDTLETVRSVYDQTYPEVEIVVVDNGSTDGTVQALRETYPRVKLVPLDYNAGIATGRNKGIAVASGDILFCLDSDASIGRDTLAHVVQKMQAEPDLGAITCRVLNAFTGELDPHTWVFTEKDKQLQDEALSVHVFTECGAALRKAALGEAGVFWDLLFFGREGEDLALRILDAGYRILYCPHALVYHRVSPERRVAGGQREYLDLRNSLYIYAVRYPWWMLPGFVPLKMGTSLIRCFRRHHLRDYVRALLDVIRALPVLWQQRRPIRLRTAFAYLGLQRKHGVLAWSMMSWLKHKM